MELLKAAALVIAGGSVYVTVELLWRGRSHPGMFALGGLCFYLLGLFDELAPGTPLAAQAVLGGTLVTVLELVFGLLWNRGRRIWDYSGKPLNLRGQICLPYFTAWIALAAAAVPLDDALRLVLFAEPWPGLRLL